jgi:hypothetical protein
MPSDCIKSDGFGRRSASELALLRRRRSSLTASPSGGYDRSPQVPDGEWPAKQKLTVRHYGKRTSSRRAHNSGVIDFVACQIGFQKIERASAPTFASIPFIIMAVRFFIAGSHDGF